MIIIPMKFHTKLKQKDSMLMVKYSLLLDEDLEKFMVTISSHHKGRTPTHDKHIVLNVLENRVGV